MSEQVSEVGRFFGPTSWRAAGRRRSVNTTLACPASQIGHQSWWQQISSEIFSSNFFRPVFGRFLSRFSHVFFSLRSRKKGDLHEIVFFPDLRMITSNIYNIKPRSETPLVGRPPKVTTVSASSSVSAADLGLELAGGGAEFPSRWKKADVWQQNPLKGEKLIGWDVVLDVDYPKPENATFFCT